MWRATSLSCGLCAPAVGTLLRRVTNAPSALSKLGIAVTIGGLIQAIALVSLVLITVQAWPDVRLAEIIPSLAFAGFGGSFVFVSLFRLVLADRPVHLAGIGSGLMITLHQSAYALGVATLGTLSEIETVSRGSWPPLAGRSPLSPRADKVVEPWKDSAEHTRQAADAIRRFLRSHVPGS